MANKTITLQLEGEHIPAQVLYYRIRNFIDVLRDVAQNVADSVRSTEPVAPVTWIVESIRSDSPVAMTLRAEPVIAVAPLDITDLAIESIVSGLSTIQADGKSIDIPHYFSLATLEDLHHLIRSGRDGITGVKIRAMEQTIAFDAKADRNIHRFLAPAYESYGSVEGILEMVSTAGSAPRFSVRDRLSGRAIRCMVPPYRLSEVLAVFNRRVSVSGRVRTNERGDILYVTMEEVTAFPSDDDLPSIRDVAGAFDLTMGRSIEEHLESLRDAS